MYIPSDKNRVPFKISVDVKAAPPVVGPWEVDRQEDGVRFTSRQWTLQDGGADKLASALADLGRERLSAMRIYVPRSALDAEGTRRLVAMQRGHEDILYRLGQGQSSIIQRQSYAVPLCQETAEVRTLEGGNQEAMARLMASRANPDAVAALRHPNNALNSACDGWWEFRYFDASVDAKTVLADVSVVLGMVGAAASGQDGSISCTAGKPLSDCYDRPVSPQRFDRFVHAVAADDTERAQLRNQFLRPGGVLAEPPSPSNPITVGLLCTPSQARTGALQEYAQALLDADAQVRMIPLDSVDAERFEHTVDAMVMPGGRPVDPKLYGEKPRSDLGRLTPECDITAKRIVERALEMGMPLLGICKGLHMMDVAAGGTLVQDILSENWQPSIQHQQANIAALGGDITSPSHDLKIEPRVEGRLSNLMQLLGTEHAAVNSSHRQTLRQVADMFAVTARAPDGVIEAVERKDCPSQWAIQFHPERQRHQNPIWNAVFTRLVADAARWRQQRYHSAMA